MGANRPKRLYPINIEPAIGGSIVRVGCQQFVFADSERDIMAREIADYISKPDETEARYRQAYPDFLYNGEVRQCAPAGLNQAVPMAAQPL